jgi:lysophospholipase L1-like esterase
MLIIVPTICRKNIGREVRRVMRRIRRRRPSHNSQPLQQENGVPPIEQKEGEIATPSDTFFSDWLPTITAIVKSELKSELGKINDKLDKISIQFNEISEINDQLNNLRCEIGQLTEAQLRPLVTKKYGEDLAHPFHIKSPYGVAQGLFY